MNKPIEVNDKDAKTSYFSQEVLVSLRKITQAIDLHSRNLSRKYGLTGPQLIILQEISKNKKISVTELSRSISLSQGTVTDILLRLEKKGLVSKKRNERDKRRIELYVTEKCRQILEKAPPPLQETFLEQFSSLDEWEQLMILSALRRIVDMMSAKKIDASPILAAGPIDSIHEKLGTKVSVAPEKHQ